MTTLKHLFVKFYKSDPEEPTQFVEFSRTSLVSPLTLKNLEAEVEKGIDLKARYICIFFGEITVQIFLSGTVQYSSETFPFLHIISGSQSVDFCEGDICFAPTEQEIICGENWNSLLYTSSYQNLLNIVNCMLQLVETKATPN